MLDYRPANTGVSILRTFAYGRVSSKDQIEKKYVANDKVLISASGSVTEQPRLCEEFIAGYKNTCPKCGKMLSLVKEDSFFDKGKSGTNADRDGIKLIMDNVETGKIDLVLVTENDRLGRNQYETQGIRNSLIKMGVQVNSVEQPKQLYCPNCYNPFEDDSGVIMDMVSDVKSHLDLCRIMRNYKVGMSERVGRGLPSGSLCYGLVKVKDEIINGARVQKYDWDKEKVKIVKRIVHEYMDLGLGMWKISQRLNGENVQSSEKKIWGRSAIKHILNNPSYAGYIRYRWKTAGRKNGKKIRSIQPREKWTLKKSVWHEKRLWGLSYYDEIQRTISQRSSMGGRATGSQALLIGLLKCGYCNYSMFQNNTKSVRKDGSVYTWKGYVCGTYTHRGACCYNGKSRKTIDDLVIQEVIKLADNPNSKKAYFDKMKGRQLSNSKSILKEKEQTLAELSKRLARASNAYLSGAFDIEQYSKEKKELLPRMSELETEIEQMRNAVINPKTNLLPDFLEVVKKIKKEYQENNCKNMQLLLRKVIERVEFKKKPLNVKITFRGN